MNRGKLARVLDRFGDAYCAQYPYRPEQQKVVTCVKQCRTEALGGVTLHCADCNRDIQQYHSCRNRHCPQCQQKASNDWRDKCLNNLLPVPYFHLVFTLPHALNGWVRLHPKVLYGLLFQSVWQTLNTFGQDPKRLNGQLGATVVLHTWGQALDQHVHLHCLIPAGAWCKGDGKWHHSRSDYLFPVKALSRLYRAKMVSALRKAYEGGELEKITNEGEVSKILNKMMRVDWVVYTKACEGDPERVVNYLSRYTHKIAISETRIVDIGRESIHFRWKDYRDGQQKIMKLPGVEFVRRFMQHVLPKGLMRVRHYGFLANAHRKKKLAAIRKALGVVSEPLVAEGKMQGDKSPLQSPESERKAATSVWFCCHCRSQRMRAVKRIEPLKRRRRPYAVVVPA